MHLASGQQLKGGSSHRLGGLCPAGDMGEDPAPRQRTPARGGMGEMVHSAGQCHPRATSREGAELHQLVPLCEGHGAACQSASLLTPALPATCLGVRSSSSAVATAVMAWLFSGSACRVADSPATSWMARSVTDTLSSSTVTVFSARMESNNGDNTCGIGRTQEKPLHLLLEAGPS